MQTWDAFDFFTVSLTVSDLATAFDRSNTDITWGITLVLMFRSVGSIIFGIAADRYGRKWPFVVNNILFIVLELVSNRVFRTSSPDTQWARHSGVLSSSWRHLLPRFISFWVSALPSVAVAPAPARRMLVIGGKTTQLPSPESQTTAPTLTWNLRLTE